MTTETKVMKETKNKISVDYEGKLTFKERLMQKQHKANAVYDMSGRRATSPKKGQTYIVNGKKRMY